MRDGGDVGAYTGLKLMIDGAAPVCGARQTRRG